MFEINKIYKNINCLDIVFKVTATDIIQVKDGSESAYKLNGIWLNRYYELIPIIEETLIIEFDKLDKWSEYKPGKQQ